MGWTSYRATHYKPVKNGCLTIDRKAECDAYFLEGLNSGYYEVLKSSIVGSTYYAAVKQLKRCGDEDENGNFIAVDIPKEEQRVWGAVFLTSTNMKDYFNFSYKDMSESMGPCRYECPKGILDLLSPTDNEYANNWRAKCYANIEKKKDKNALNNLPAETIIKVVMPFDTRYYKAGDVVKLTKRKHWTRGKTHWYANSTLYFTAGLMRMLDGHYEIIKRGEC